jgi:four helix bundle protein
MLRALDRGMEIKNFTESIVWQRALDLIVDVYAITSKYPRSETFGLAFQTNKSSVSIASNIAEGFKRQRRLIATYINHLEISLGSEGELFTQLVASKRLGFAKEADLKKPLAQLSEIGRMLNGLITSLEEKEQEQLEQRRKR